MTAKIHKKILKKQLPADVENAFVNIANAIIDPSKNKMSICLVAGSKHNEGATFVSLNIARTLARQIGGRILWTDIHFQSEILRSSVSSEDSDSKVQSQYCGIDHSGIENLDLFLSDQWLGKPSEAVKISQIQHFFDHVSGDYDYIIWDGKPINLYPDSRAFAAIADSVLLVAQAHKTRREVIQKAKDSIVQRNGNFLGIVLNKRRFFIPNFIYRLL